MPIDLTPGFSLKEVIESAKKKAEKYVSEMTGELPQAMRKIKKKQTITQEALKESEKY